MKVICDNCQTKYNAPDDKVRGKTLKIKCKKCSHLIVVSGLDESPVDSSANYAAAYQERSLEMSVSSAEVWHLVVNEQQIGPLSTEDVMGRLQRGEVSVDTFAWREGFASWSPLATISEFAAFAPPVSEPEVEATSLYNMNAEQPALAENNAYVPAAEPILAPKVSLAKSAPAVADSFASAPDPFASAPAATDPFASAPAAADPFASAPAAADPFASAPAAQPAFGQTPSANSMTAARADSSVLFSLTNLQALAVGTKDAKASPKAAPSATSNTEGSGLIDIRSMSSALQFSKEKDKKSPTQASEEVVFASNSVGFAGDSAAAFAAAAVPGNIMMPRENKSKATLVLAIVGGIAAVVALTVGILFMAGVFEKTPAVAPTANVAAVATPPVGDAAGTLLAAATPGAAPTEVSPETPRPGATPSKAAVSPTAKSTAPLNTKPTTATPKASEDPVLAAINAKPTAPVVVTPEPPKAPSNAGKHNDELDEILNGGKSGSSGGSGASGPETLSQSQIQKVMGGAKFDSCKAVGTGKVNAKVTISGSGSVSNVSTDGTPVGSCVAGVIKRLKFPSFGGSSQTFSYPVFVR